MRAKVRIVETAMMIAVFLTACTNSKDSIISQPTDDLVSSLFEGKNGRIFELTRRYSPFIRGIEIVPDRYPFDEQMCIHINGQFLWNSGDTAQIMSSHYASREHFQIDIDGIPQRRPAEVTIVNPLIEVFALTPVNGQNDSWTNLSYCVNTTPLDIGDHEASIKLIDTMGNNHVFSWNFVIREGG